jgi:Fe-S cluster assembly protein SufD
MITDTIDFRKIIKNEPEWLYKLRRDSWSVYHDSPLPERVVHLWRYTPPEQFLLDNPHDAMTAAIPVPKGNGHKIKTLTEDQAALGYNLSDMTALTRLAPELSEQGVRFLDLATAIETGVGPVQEYFGKLISSDFGKFEAANMALWNIGFYLYVPDNVVIEKPIYLNRVPTGTNTMTRLLVVAGKNSQATLIDSYRDETDSNAGLFNSVIEIFANDHSRLRYVGLQDFSEKITGYITQRSRIGNQTDLLTVQSILGGTVSKVNTGTILDGRGGNSRIHGLLFGDNHQHFDLHTLHNHRSHEAYSNIDVKVVLKDKATSAYTGLIRIEEKTVNNEAYQENRNLLLNHGPKAESIPELEILSDEVRCTHGATMGPLDPDMIFYLKSRGIDYKQAVRMIVSGFFEPTLKNIPDDLHDAVNGIILDKLEKH